MVGVGRCRRCTVVGFMGRNTDRAGASREREFRGKLGFAYEVECAGRLVVRVYLVRAGRQGVLPDLERMVPSISRACGDSRIHAPFWRRLTFKAHATALTLLLGALRFLRMFACLRMGAVD